MSPRILVPLAALLLAACGSSEGSSPADAGVDAPFAIPDSSAAAHVDGGPLADAGPPARVTKHAGRVLASMQLFAIYLSVPADGGAASAPNADDRLTWLVSSAGYWSRLAEYDVHDGAFLGSAIVPLTSVVTASHVSSGMIAQKDFADGVATFLRASSGSGAAIPSADAYAFFLPDGVNIILPSAQGSTCVNVAAYHDDDGLDAFAVFPPCGAGRDDRALSHELTETATDPYGTGWYSNADYANGGGEISDLCVDDSITVDGHVCASFWSEASQRCIP